MSAVSGREDPLITRLRQIMSPLCDEMATDALGNLFCRLKANRAPSGGRSATVMLAAHVDEIGLIVQWIEPSGALRVLPVGGVNMKTVLSSRVIVHGRKPLVGTIGTVPPHLTSAQDREKLPEWSDVFVDLGLDAATVNRLVRPGDPVSFDVQPVPLLGDRMTGKSLDNRAGLAAAVLAFESLAQLEREVDVVFAATTQEEIGLRGATAAAYSQKPDVAIVIDVGFADMPAVSDRESIKMGFGPAISIGPNVHPGVRHWLEQLAQRDQLKHQFEVLPGNSGTDAWAIQVAGSGIPTALLSIPLRYMHSTVEIVSLADVEATASMLSAFCASLTVDQVKGWQGAQYP